jgi:hypothetical protein
MTSQAKAIIGVLAAGVAISGRAHADADPFIRFVEGIR